MKIEEKFDFFTKKGYKTGLRGQIGLERTKETDRIVKDHEVSAGFGKFSVIIIATSLFTYCTLERT
jgi:hypothetical protein